MANVKFPRKEFESALGKKISQDLEEKIALFGTPLESLTQDEIEIEIFPNRPDLLSMQGFLRGFKAFLGQGRELKKYKLNKPEKNYKVKIEPSVKEVRPFTTCAIVKNLKLDDVAIKQIIDLQEKIHNTLGRARKKVAIGIYPLEKIKLPITYKALPPKQIKFIPLESHREMTGEQILRKHPKGKEYAHLLEKEKLYPIFIDAKSNILSMPPIINSHGTGKVDKQTKEIFVECSGNHLPTLQKTLNILVTTLADMGGKIYQMDLSYGSKKITTPDLTPEKISISQENTNKLLGLEIKENQLQKLLQKMGYEYKSGKVTVPAWRTDILHEVDLIEDVAIAYGYNNLTPEVPNVATVAQESQKEKIKSKISEILIGLGFLEISTYHLIKQNEAELAKIKNPIELDDSKTEYKILRPSLLIPALRILTENKDHDYPQEFFETGIVFEKDGENETGIKEKENLLILSSPANFTKLKKILSSLTNSLNTKYSLEEFYHSKLIEGRTGEIKISDKKVGYIGELHPETLRAWGIKMPAAVLELDLEEIFKKL